MSNDMIDLAAGDMRLRRRLEAYADLRLSPDLTASSRMRARVLAHAHRRADLVRADAALTIVPLMASRTPPRMSAEHRLRRARRSAMALIAAALLAGGMVGAAAASSGPGGALYEARLWVESATLPAEPSARAVAQLSRLGDRLREADAAASRGDERAAATALSAYERILNEASAAVVEGGDPVAAAALETGLARNVEVLQTLIGEVPTRAGAAISAAVERAIERSDGAIHAVGTIHRPTPPDNATGGNAAGGRNGASGGGTNAGGTGGGSNGNAAGGSNGNGPQPTPKPTHAAPERPDATGKPAATDHPAPTPKPTPDPTKAPKPSDAHPGGPPGDPQD